MRFTAETTRKKHLHGRGEDSPNYLNRGLNWETPPRTWRRPPASALSYPQARNTSTGVEKTVHDLAKRNAV